jgi:hypothetical protein
MSRLVEPRALTLSTPTPPRPSAAPRAPALLSRRQALAGLGAWTFTGCASTGGGAARGPSTTGGSTASPAAAGAGPILGQGRFRYRVVPGWGVLDPARVPVNDCNGIVCDRKNRLLVLTNDTRNNVVIYDKAGRVLGTWGDKFPGAHGLSIVEENGEEFLFITDTNLHKVFKTTLDGRVVMALGYPAESGVYEKESQYRPSATLHAPNGDFYVLDGYGIDYVMHYDHTGKLLRTWGGKIGDADAQLAHWGPHGGGVDLRDAARPLIVIAMSDQQYLKRFNLDGTYVDTLPMPGANPRQIVTVGEHLFIPTLGDDWPKNKDCHGFISVLDRDNRVVANIGGKAPTYDGATPRKMQQDGGHFMHPHAVAVDDEGALYVAQWMSKKTYPLKLVPVA